jgi:hypothetical protein
MSVARTTSRWVPDRTAEPAELWGVRPVFAAAAIAVVALAVFVVFAVRTGLPAIIEPQQESVSE